MKISPELKAQINSDISICETHTDIKGSEKLYSQMIAKYTVLDSQFANNLSTNGKLALNGSECDYRPELQAIVSKLKMYLLMEDKEASKYNPLQERVAAFIQKGEAMRAEKYRPEIHRFPNSFIEGSVYNTWMSEINIFNDRYLKDHPLHDDIHSAFFHRITSLSAFDEMMGHLNAVLNDADYWGNNKEKKETMKVQRAKSIDQLLSEDIRRCGQFVNNTQDIGDIPLIHNMGTQLYIELTAKYNDIIANLGHGLYKYDTRNEYFNPDLDMEALRQNLTIILNKMIAYQAVNYSPTEEIKNTNREMNMSNKVFIVHGHDDAAKQEMARTLEKAGMEAIILHEQADTGLTIIEKIERYTNVNYAVVLYTECDLGRSKEDPVEKEKYRARQNVVFEHGYLISKLGRDHVSALVKGDVETPGDISGVVYTPMDASGAWKMTLAKNMKAIGMPIDLNTFCG